jgi:hypothetical protein
MEHQRSIHNYAAIQRQIRRNLKVKIKEKTLTSEYEKVLIKMDRDSAALIDNLFISS